MNLSEAQVATKRLIFFAIVFTTLYYMGRVALMGAISLYQSVFPPKPAPVEARFGPLPRLKMTPIAINGAPQYQLETESGRLPRFPDRLKVYPIIKPKPNLLYEQRVKKMAKDLGFTGAHTKLSAADFRWIDGTNNRNLQANVVTRHFTLDTEINRLSSVISITPTITESDAINITNQFIKSQGLITPLDLENMTYTTVPTIISFGKFKDTKINPSKARIIKVDVIRNIKKTAFGRTYTYPVLGPNPNSSLISFFITNDKNTFKFAKANFAYWEIDYKNGSDYFLSPIDSVWSAVKQGKGVPVYTKLKSANYYDTVPPYRIKSIDIRDIYIAYYETVELADYLQPIYVFKGQFLTEAEQGKLSKAGEIMIFYPAVRGDFVK